MPAFIAVALLAAPSALVVALGAGHLLQTEYALVGLALLGAAEAL